MGAVPPSPTEEPPLSTPPIRPTERFEQAVLPMSVVSLEGRTVLANRAMCRLVRRSREDLVGAPAAAVCAPEDRDALAGVLSAAHGGEDGGELSVGLEAPDGTRGRARLAWSLMRDDAGRPWYLTAVWVDETERVRAEQALAASEARWRSLLTHAADITWTADPDGRLTSVTPGVARLGHDPEALVGRPAEELVAPDDRDGFAASWRRVASGAVPQEVLVCRLATTDGRESWARVVLTDLQSDPHVAAVAGNAVDITVERREEQARVRLEGQLRARFEQSTAPQGVLDRAGRFIAVNAAFGALLGLPPEAVAGRAVQALTSPDDPGTADAVLGRLLRGELDTAHVERVLQAADGSPVPVRVDLVVLRDERGDIDGVAGIVTDQTPLLAAEAERRQQEALFEALSRRASDLALVGDAQGKLLYASPAVFHMLGYRPDDVVGVEGFEFVHPEDVPAVRDAYEKVVTEGGTQVFRFRALAADGSWRWIEETATDLLATAVAGVVCNLRDVTAEVEVLEALRASEERHRAIADAAQEGIWAVDADGRTLYANARTAELLGLQLEDVYERSAPDLFDATAGEELRRRLDPCRARGKEVYDLRYRHPDGGERRLRISAGPLLRHDGEPEGSLAMVSDVTDEVRGQEELQQAWLHDGLTGLPNAALIRDRLLHALGRGNGPTAVMRLDLDRFSVVNDAYGHAVGDEVLRAVADRLARAVPAQHSVGRSGGDEFTIVWETADEAAAVSAAQQLLCALSEPVETTAGPVTVAASVGVAVDGETPEDLLRQAGTALAGAKAAGRGRVMTVDVETAQRARRRSALVTDLRRALVVDELDVHYQPVFSLDTGRIVGLEALVRWHSEVHGEVTPGELVPAAEDAGLIGQVDLHVARRAFADLASLRTSGAVPADATVAVNLSALDLADPALEDRLLQAVADAGLTPDAVVLEITESTFVDDRSAAIALLRRLREHGFGVAVDDFGTGWSSLSHLRDLPVSVLKVDRAFVATIAEDRDALAIVASIVDLARTIGVTVVAEGVETVEQATLLRGLGCGTAQGWLWSRAVSCEEVARQRGWVERPALAPAPSTTGTSRRRAPRAAATGEHGLRRLLELHRSGASLATIAAALNREGFRTPSGQRWHHTSVARAVADAAYPALQD